MTTKTAGGWRRRGLAVTCGLLAAGAAAAAWLCWPHARPSVVLVTVDTLRPDRLGAYRRTFNRTPAIDRLAAEGMLFETAYCDVPWTTASMSSVMTGQYSNVHGVEFPTHRLDAAAVTMAERFQQAGYQTGAVIGSFPLDSIYGLDQGFESYDQEFDRPMIAVPGAVVKHVEAQLASEGEGKGADNFLEKMRNDAYRDDESVTDAALRWLTQKRDPSRPFFLWVHYYGPHEKWLGDRGFVEQEPDVIAAYDPDVEKNDTAVGRLLDYLRSSGLLDRSLVVLHSDHGQNLGEHGFVGHGSRIDEQTVRVPMILRYPAEIPAGLRRKDIARNIDILPTVLAAAGLPAEGLAGRSMLPSGDDPEGLRVAHEAQTAYFETHLTTLNYVPLWAPPHGTVLGPVWRTGLRTTEWKLLEDQVTGPCRSGLQATRDGVGSWSIFNSQELPEEDCRAIRQRRLLDAAYLPSREVEVTSAKPELLESLSELLAGYREQKASMAGQFQLSPDAEQKLRSLGYLR